MPEHGKNEAEKKRNKGIHSLKNQITLIFISLLFLSILAITLINHIFLERYYISRKTDVLLAARESLSTMDFSDMIQYEDEAGEEGSFSYPSDFERGSSRQNLSWVVMEPEYTLTYCYPDNDIVLRSKIFGYAYGVDEDQEHSRIIVAENGVAYHTDPDCVNLNPRVREVDASDLDHLRANDGSIYHPCEYCHPSKSGKVYVTPDGNRYHNSRSCTRLMRTTHEETMEEASSHLHPCPKCGHEH